MAMNRTDYNRLGVEAAHAVLLELVHALGAYRNDMVVVGGWVPTLLLPDAPEKHIGSTDVDIAFNHRTINETVYATIREQLVQRGYREGTQPFIFFRTVQLENTAVEVEVDLLAAEYGGTASSHRTQRVQDIKIRKARGCELAFEHQDERTIEGTLPGGAKDTVTVKVAAIVPFIVMKGMALYDRIKEKDAWDIYYCVKHFPGGTAALTTTFRTHLSNALVREGLNKIAEKFATIDHFGPTAVADFNEISDSEERAVLKRDAYERIQALLRGLHIV
jgi:hypothetical protein